MAAGQNPLKNESELIKDYGLIRGNFNISDEDKELCDKIPS